PPESPPHSRPPPRPLPPPQADRGGVDAAGAGTAQAETEAASRGGGIRDLMYSITHLESIPSTNDEILARVRAGSAAPGEVLVAREQTRGRGRMGRQWSSEVGGLWFTAAMPLHGEHLGW